MYKYHYYTDKIHLFYITQSDFYTLTAAKVVFVVIGWSPLVTRLILGNSVKNHNKTGK